MNNQALVDELMPGLQGRDLETGEVRYRQALAFLHDNADAYALFDEAHSAIADDDFDIALLNLGAAIDMLPAEPRFSGLKGDILLYQGKYRDAVDAYDDAIALDDNYFDYYLGRGVSYARLGQRAQARSDLERSTALLPTAVAMNELGKIALVNNQRQAAKQYFREAAQAQGQVAREATLSFTRIDLEDNPRAYLNAAVYADDEGRIYARVSNNSSLPVEGVAVEFTAVIGGRLGRQTRTVSTLGGNSAVTVSSGMRFADGQPWSADQMQASVVAARVSD